MNWIKKIIFVVAVFSFISCQNSHEMREEIQVATSKNTEDFEIKKVDSDHLIYVDDLKELFYDTNVFLIDFRDVDLYQQGHIPGAVNIYRKDITVTEGEIKGLIAPEEKIKKILSDLGVDNSKQLIVYDGSGACESARFWWTMNYYGFTNIKVLNGDYDLWASKDYETDTITPQYPMSEFIFPKIENQKYIATKEDVINALTDTNVILVDTRTIEEYKGYVLKNGALRQGRIPGSIHIDWSNNIQYNDGREFKSINDLAYDFEKKGVTKDKEIIFYCQSGTRSAHSTFVLAELLGYKNVKNYDGSWIEWSHDLNLKIERDSIPLETTNLQL